MRRTYSFERKVVTLFDGSWCVPVEYIPNTLLVSWLFHVYIRWLHLVFASSTTPSLRSPTWLFINTRVHGLQNSGSFWWEVRDFISSLVRPPHLKYRSYLSPMELNWWWKWQPVFKGEMCFPFFGFRPLPKIFPDSDCEFYRTTIIVLKTSLIFSSTVSTLLKLRAESSRCLLYICSRNVVTLSTSSQVGHDAMLWCGDWQAALLIRVQDAGISRWILSLARHLYTCHGKLCFCRWIGNHFLFDILLFVFWPRYAPRRVCRIFLTEDSRAGGFAHHNQRGGSASSPSWKQWCWNSCE